MNVICFKKDDFKLYIFLLICFFIFILYIFSKKYEKMTNIDLVSHLSHKELIEKIISLQESLFNIQLEKQNCEKNLQQIQNLQQTQQSVPDLISSRFLNKIYNPISPPESIYRDKYDSYQRYQQIGFLTNVQDGQFPVFARDKYMGKSDKQEYYTINEGRNHVKIPFKTKNYNELFDGDQVNVPELSNNTFIFKKYETENIRYNPNAF
jgi:hypothetical protein